jgi:hypothetical protein
VDPKTVLEDFCDFLAPKLDTYESAIYLYAVRHSRLQGAAEVVIGFKSARRKMALGIGEKGKPMSEHTCYEKLHSLEQKQCLEILCTERAGTRIRVRLPAEVPGLIPPIQRQRELTLDELDFFEIAEHRLAIRERENGHCFYCLRALDGKDFVVEHVESRPTGSNSYWNVVAACRSCNNRKGALIADDFLRVLYRDGLLSLDDFGARRAALESLRRRDLKPSLKKG